MKVPTSKLYLNNRSINIPNQKKTNLYQSVLKSLSGTPMVNPLLVVKNPHGKFAVVHGNNRFLAGYELGFDEFEVRVIPDANPKTIKANCTDYKKVEGVDV
tara:strand:+ start:331 stop:633 length:303 start_codon:yes stop_codon:yes gene_type:complete